MRAPFAAGYITLATGEGGARMAANENAGTASDQATCVYCGATENLVEDEFLEGLYYCPSCLERHRRHSQQIDELGEAEPPWDG